MKTLIRLKIERLIEHETEYFVATSDDLQGLVAEGRSLQEAIEIAEDVAKSLLALEQEMNHDLHLRAVPAQFEYPLILEV
jgi:predicted RNase H-like HicB family nuclease